MQLGLGKLNSILQQPPFNPPLLYGRALRPRGLEKERSVELSVPHPILHEIRNQVSFALSDGAFGEPWCRSGAEVKASVVPAQGFPLSSLLSTRRRALSACCFPNNPKDDGRGSVLVSAQPCLGTTWRGAPTKVFPTSHPILATTPSHPHSLCFLCLTSKKSEIDPDILNTQVHERRQS